MKPADFFIGSREFFGSLIPGLLWLLAMALLLVNASIHNLLEFAADANWIEALSFIGLSLLIGTLLQHISFNFSRKTLTLVSRASISIQQIGFIKENGRFSQPASVLFSPARKS
ncbi:MAG: hypothetical protein M3461_05475 [Pseudomonadota bacterium]|nr:hypothetical protein [Pseudomonadota bacterium]